LVLCVDGNGEHMRFREPHQQLRVCSIDAPNVSLRAAEYERVPRLCSRPDLRCRNRHGSRPFGGGYQSAVIGDSRAAQSAPKEVLIGVHLPDLRGGSRSSRAEAQQEACDPNGAVGRAVAFHSLMSNWIVLVLVVACTEGNRISATTLGRGCPTRPGDFARSSATDGGGPTSSPPGTA